MKIAKSFQHSLKGILLLCALSAASFAQPVYEVTITNLTKSQILTPALVVAHSRNIKLFQPGQPASPALEALAEEGNTQPYVDSLSQERAVRDTATGTAPILPGQSETITINAKFRDVISYSAMLLPTNDGFAAVRSLNLPRFRSETKAYATAWDAGTEVNDELCSSIPGPAFEECAASTSRGGAPEGGEEGYIYIHQGITQNGDFSLSRNFNNPVALVEVKRVFRR